MTKPSRREKPETANSKKHREHDATSDEIREENLDKTIEDSFPASDPPSSIPDPDEDEGKDAA
jgi:hypothetical protein